MRCEHDADEDRRHSEQLTEIRQSDHGADHGGVRSKKPKRRGTLKTIRPPDAQKHK